MKYKILTIIYIVSIAVGCNYKSGSDIIILKEFDENNVVDVTGDLLLELKYSNIVFYENGKRLIMPVFRGDKGSIEMETIDQYYIKKGKLEQIPGIKITIGTFTISCKKGENKKTFYEFLNFYKSNILMDIDIEHPTCMSLDHGIWIIYYHYSYKGIPCCLKINIKGIEKGDNKYTSVYEIQPDESETGFIYSFTQCCSQVK